MCEAFFELFKDEIAAKFAVAEEIIRKETEEKTEARVRSETEAKIKASENRIRELESELAKLKKRQAN